MRSMSTTVSDFCTQFFSCLTHTHTFHRPSPPPKYCSSSSSSSTSATVMTFWDMDRAHAGRPPAAVEPNSKTTGYRLTLTLFHGSAAAMHMQQLRYFASQRHAQTSYFSGGGTLASIRKNTQQLIRPPARCHCSIAGAPPAAYYAYSTLSIVNTIIQTQHLKAIECNFIYFLVCHFLTQNTLPCLDFLNWSLSL